jgi:hypothetical protein
MACSTKQHDIKMIVQLIETEACFVSNVALLGMVMPAPHATGHGTSLNQVSGATFCFSLGVENGFNSP